MYYYRRILANYHAVILGVLINLCVLLSCGNSSSNPSTSSAQVSITPETLTIVQGEKAQVAASVTPADENQSVNWTSDNTAVASITSDGVVTGEAPGQTTISAASAENPQKFGQCTITVLPAELADEAAGNTTNSPEKWYYFNGAVHSTYNISWDDAENSACTGNILVSVYRGNNLTPFVENQDTGTVTISTDHISQKIFIRVTKKGTADGDFVIRHAKENGPSPNTWTFMFYLNAYDLESFFIENIKKLIDSYHANVGINIVFLVDKDEINNPYGIFDAPFSDTRLFTLNNDGFYQIHGGSFFDNKITMSSQYEANMGDPQMVKKFIEFSKNKFPAEKYALIFICHGMGIAGFSADVGPFTDFMLDTDRLHAGELSDVLTSEHSVNLIGFDSCLMGNLETAYQFRKDGSARFQADYMLGSARSAEDSWIHGSILQRININGGVNATEEDVIKGMPTEAIYTPSSLTAKELALLFVEEHRDYSMATYPTTIGIREMLSAYDLDKVTAVKNAIDAMAVSLHLNSEQTQLEIVRDDWNSFLIFHYFSGYADQQKDKEAQTYYSLYEVTQLCDVIKNNPSFSVNTQNYAIAARDALTTLIAGSYCGDYSINTHGLSMFFTNNNFGDPPLFADQWWYSPLDVSLRGASTPQKFYGKLDWCARRTDDVAGQVNSWFELMDAWYDTDPAPGGYNNYQY